MLFRSAKEIALMSIMTALLIAGQLVFAAVQGVEIVTVALLFILMFFSLLETQEVSFPSPLISMFADSHL